MPAPMPPDGASNDRRPALFVLAGAAVAIVAIPLAAAAGPPYLSFSALSPWIVVYAIGLFCALFATPFLIHSRLGGRLEADARWERAVLWWALVAICVLAASVVCGLPSGFDSGSLGGAIGLVGVTEALARARHLGRLAAQRLTPAVRLDARPPPGWHRVFGRK